MSTGKSIRLFLVDGTPTGLITAEITNWSGHVLVSPRGRIHEALARPEGSKTGVYLLVGEDESSREMVYVGEGDSIAERVRDHAKDDDKQFWARVFLVTSKDLNLTKAHVRYLESRLVQIIRQGGRAECVNGNNPAQGNMPEADASDMDFFLSQLQILLPAVGLTLLRPPAVRIPAVSLEHAYSIQSATDDATSEGPLHVRLIHKIVGVIADGFESDGEILVLRDSLGTGKKYTSNSYGALRQRLIDSGDVVVLDTGQIRFVKDVTFRSPSAAAAVLNNCNSNGRTEWKLVPSGMTLGAWWNKQLERGSQKS